MFKPSAAPRWKSTTSCFLFGIGVAATARCKNAGMALRPTMAIPPCFKKYLRENLKPRTPSQHSCFISDSSLLRFLNLNYQLSTSLPSLKFRRAQYEPRNHTQIHAFDGIVQPRL